MTQLINLTKIIDYQKWKIGVLYVRVNEDDLLTVDAFCLSMFIGRNSYVSDFSTRLCRGIVLSTSYSSSTECSENLRDESPGNETMLLRLWEEHNFRNDPLKIASSGAAASSLSNRSPLCRSSSMVCLSYAFRPRPMKSDCKCDPTPLSPNGRTAEWVAVPGEYPVCHEAAN